MEAEKILSEFSGKAICEEWRDIEGYNGAYQVSNLGNVRSFSAYRRGNGRLLSCTDNGYGYLIVGLNKNNKRKNHYVHRLVAEAFIENPNGYSQVNHLDYNRKNNRVSNLEWCTPQANTRYSSHKGRHPRKHNKTTTGEQYICMRGGRYRVTISHKYDMTFPTLEEAIAKRNEIVKELGYDKYIEI